MYCSNCGFDCKEARFCPKCGSKIYNGSETTNNTEVISNTETNNVVHTDQSTQQKIQYTERKKCPCCGSDDLLYETNHKSTRGTLAGNGVGCLVLIIGFIVVFFGLSFLAFMVAGPIIALIFIIIAVVIFIIANSGRKDGSLRITCKSCGHTLRLKNGELVTD